MAADREGLDLKRELADYEREGSEMLSEDEEDDYDDELYFAPCSRTDLVFASNKKRRRKRARHKKGHACSKAAKATGEDLPPLIKVEPQNNFTNKENLKNDQMSVIVPQEVDIIVDFTQAVPTLSEELGDIDRFTMAHSKEKRPFAENDDEGRHNSDNNNGGVYEDDDDDNDCSSSDEEIIVTDDRLVTIAPIKVVDGKIVVLMGDNNNPLEASKDPNVSKDSNISKDLNIDLDQEEIDVMEVSSNGSPTENGETVTSGDAVGPMFNEGTTKTTTTTTTKTGAMDEVLEDDDLTQAVDEDLMENIQNIDRVLSDGGVGTKGTDGDLTDKMDEDSAEAMNVGLSETMDQDLTEAAVEDTEKTLEDSSARNENETDNDPVLKMGTLESEKDSEEMEKVGHKVREDLSNGEGSTDSRTTCSQGEEGEEEKGLQQKDENSQQLEEEEEEDKNLKEKEDSSQQEQDDGGGVKLHEGNKDLEPQEEQESIRNGGERDNTQTGTVGAATVHPRLFIARGQTSAAIISNHDGATINSNNNGSTSNGVAINSNSDGPTANDDDDDIGYEITPSLVQKFQSCSESQDPIVSNKRTAPKSDEMGFFDFEISESQVNNMNKPESQKLPPLAPPPSLSLAPPSLPPLSTFPLPSVNESQDHLPDLNDAPMVPPTSSQTRSCPRQSSPPPLPPSLTPHHSPPAKRRKTKRLEISRGGSEIRKLSPLINKDSMKLAGWDLREKIPQRQYFLRIVIPEGVGKFTSSGRLVFDGEEGPVWYHRFCVAGRSGSYGGVSHCKSNPPHPCATVLQNTAQAISSTTTTQSQAAITSSSIPIPSSSVAPLSSTADLIGRSSFPVPPPSAPPTIDMSIYDDTVQDGVGGVSQCANKIVLESDDERVSSPDSADHLISTRCLKDSEETLPAAPSTRGKTLATAVNTQSTTAVKTSPVTVKTSAAAKNLSSTLKSTASVAKNTSSKMIPSSTTSNNAAPTKKNTAAAKKSTTAVAKGTAVTKNTSSAPAKDTTSIAKKNTTSVPSKDTTSTSTAKDTSFTAKKSSPGAKSITSSVATSASDYVVSKSRAFEIMREFYIKQAYYNYEEKN